MGGSRGSGRPDRSGRQIVPLLLLVLVLLSACASDPDDYQPRAEGATQSSGPGTRKLLLGVLPCHSPGQVMARYSSFALYLSSALDTPVEVTTAPSFAHYLERLRAGEYDLIISDPYSYVLVRGRPGYRAVAKVKGDDYRGLLVVRRGSNIRKIADLKGKTLAFPDPTLLADTMMVKSYLRARGLRPERDIVSRFVGSPESVLWAVHDGLVDAGGSWPGALETVPVELRESLQVLFKTEALPHRPIALRSDLDEHLRERITSILLSMGNDHAGRHALLSMGVSGFVAAEEEDYDKVREWVRRSNYPL